MNWKEFSKQYFGVTRRERLAILVLVGLILLVFLAPRLTGSVSKLPAGGADTAWISSLRKLEEKEPEKEGRPYSAEHAGNNYNSYGREREPGDELANKELFHFDPNTLSVDGWKRLGIREKTIHTIQNYLSKGGRFRKPGDLERIYGLFPDEYERIAPYIQIAEGYQEIKEREPARELDKAVKSTASRYAVIDINTADTSAFISLPGIGSKLAARIVNFRDKLGGFYSISQVAEIYGLPDSTFQKIKPWLKLESMELRKIKINTVTTEELKAHPYIRYTLANPILAYRKEHGSFGRLDELKNVMAVTEDIYQKILPYLELE